MTPSNGVDAGVDGCFNEIDITRTIDELLPTKNLLWRSRHGPQKLRLALSMHSELLAERDCSCSETDTEVLLVQDQV